MFGNDWDNVLKDIMDEKWFCDLIEEVKKEYKTKTIFPLEQNIFNAFIYTPFNSVKVVILGQDPYHGEKEAHGLSFSVREGVKMPPSLANIFKELEDDLGIKRTKTDLSDWAYQGVLLLNLYHIPF